MCVKCKNCEYLKKYYNRYNDYKAECWIPFSVYYDFVNNIDNEEHELYEDIEKVAKKYIDFEEVQKFIISTGLKSKDCNDKMKHNYITSDFWKNENHNCPFYQKKVNVGVVFTLILIFSGILTYII